MEDGD
jgi:hypothetical protein